MVRWWRVQLHEETLPIKEPIPEAFFRIAWAGRVDLTVVSEHGLVDEALADPVFQLRFVVPPNQSNSSEELWRRGAHLPATHAAHRKASQVRTLVVDPHSGL